MKITFNAVTLLLAVILSAGCDMGETMMLGDYNKTIATEIRELIANELRVGSTSHEIESFFRKHEIDHSYNRFAERYKGIIRDISGNEKVDQAVVIHIYVDDEKAFKSSEVYDSFTAL